MHYYYAHVAQDGSYWALPVPENVLEHADRAREVAHGGMLVWCALVVVFFVAWWMRGVHHG